MTQLVFIVISLIILSLLKQKIPYNTQEFLADLRKYSVILTLFLAHHIVAWGVTNYMASTRDYSVLIGIWNLGMPLLVLTYYTRGKKQKVWELRYVIAVAVCYYVVMTVGQFLMIILGGGLDTQSLSEGIDVWWLARRVSFMLFIYYPFISVAEELLFRVTMFELLKKWGVKKEAVLIVVTGVLFGLAHGVSIPGATGVFRTAAVVNVFSTTLMGIAWGAVYASRKNLLHVAFLHWLIWIGNIGRDLFAVTLFLALAAR